MSGLGEGMGFLQAYRREAECYWDKTACAASDAGKSFWPVPTAGGREQ